MSGGFSYVKFEPNKDFVLPELASDPDDFVPSKAVIDRRPGGSENPENQTKPE
jgi:hypothetical protein